MYKYRVLGYTTSGNGKRFYKIQDLETGEIFESATEAAKKTPGTLQNKICMVCSKEIN